MGSPNKMIIGSASPKLTGKKPKTASKRKWGEANFVVAGRATKVGAASHRPAIQNGLLALSPSERATSVRPGDVGRLVETCAISIAPELAPKGLSTLKADFYQIGTAGPAAYLPKAFTVEQMASVGDFPKHIRPALRPIFLLFPHDGQEGALQKLREELAGKGTFAVARVRTVETAACASNTVTTFRHAQDDVLALFPPGQQAESEMGEHKVSVDNYLVCMWVRLPPPAAQGQQQ